MCALLQPTGPSAGAGGGGPGSSGSRSGGSSGGDSVAGSKSDDVDGSSSVGASSREHSKADASGDISAGSTPSVLEQLVTSGAWQHMLEWADDMCHVALDAMGVAPAQ